MGGSFLVIGDWGWDGNTHGNVKSTNCQQTIAKAMLHKLKELGDVKFIINVGDSFYPNGVTSKEDPQWDTKWRSVYAPELRAIPWFSVYGNHDYQHDPCACGGTCAQVNHDITDRDFFFMPGNSYFREHPELDIEIVGLDLNQYMDAWKAGDLTPLDCGYTSCKAECEATLEKRATEAFGLFFNRTDHSNAKNLIVFSHYPTDYFKRSPEFLNELKSTKRNDGGVRHVEYFGGHRHNVDQTSTVSIAPNSNWLVGGGGGWSCDGEEQGFVVGEIDKAGAMNTYSVLVDSQICCGSMQFRK